MQMQSPIDLLGVIINFTAHEPRLIVAQETDGTEPRALAFRLQLATGESVRLPDDRSLNDATWSLRIVEADKPSSVGPDGRQAVGGLLHFEEHEGEHHRPRIVT